MVDSDDDYVEDDDIRPSGTRNRGRGRAQSSSRTNEPNFQLDRTWENVTEAADGTITRTVEGLYEAEKRKR